MKIRRNPSRHLTDQVRKVYYFLYFLSLEPIVTCSDIDKITFIFWNRCVISILEEEESAPIDGRILFKKPTKKREADEKSADDGSTIVKKKKKKDKKPEKSLLSFDDEEEESWPGM